MDKFRLLFASIVLTAGFLFLAKPSFASEGTVELRSTNNQDYRCFASSLLMENSKYKVLVSCRDLIYPPQLDIFSYIMWGNPISSSRPVRLGALGVGKASFETKNAFSRLYVTIEQNKNTRSPSDQIVMTGNVQRIAFLDRPTTPTPTLEGAEETEVEITPAGQATSLREKVALAFKRAGIIVFLGLVAIIGLVFVLTRPK